MQSQPGTRHSDRHAQRLQSVLRRRPIPLYRATIIASRPRICRHGDGAEGYHYTRLQIRYRRPLSTSAFPGAAPNQRRGIYNGGNEYVLTNTAVVIALAFSGAGKWSADNAIGRDVAAIAWGLGALGRQ